MKDDAKKMSDADWKDLISNPQPPDDPDENAEIEEWVYFDNGKWITCRRPRQKERIPFPKK